MIEILFWTSAAAVLYTYLLFPLIIWGWSRLRPKPLRASEITPTVTVIIAAHNEEQSIGAKLASVLDCDYPRDCLDILVASDGSTDATEAIARQYSTQGVRVLSLPRRGKAAALNDAVAAATGQILVFTDANSMFAATSLKNLVAPFADPEVGGVAGDQRYDDRSASESSDSAGERQYWSLDRRLKQAESLCGNVISATGALYAIRRSLFQEVPEGVTDDFVTSTRVIQQGQRLVFAANAVAYEPVAKSSRVEFGRKVRVITRGLRGVLVMRSLLNPFRYGIYSLQLFSHKILRRLMVFPLLALLIGSGLLWPQGLVYRIGFVVQAACYALALAGAFRLSLGKAPGKLLAIPFYFCMVNTACLLASFKVLARRKIVLWEPQRESSVDTDSDLSAPAA